RAALLIQQASERRAAGEGAAAVSERVVQPAPILPWGFLDRARADRGPSSGANIVRVGPREDLGLGQQRPALPLARLALLLQQPGERGAPGQPPAPEFERRVDRRPGLAGRIPNGTGHLAGPAASTGVMGIRPGENLGDREKGKRPAAFLSGLFERTSWATHDGRDLGAKAGKCE